MLKLLALLFVSFASFAGADILPQMQGDWTGSGWAREAPTSPKESLRCRLKNHYDVDVLTIKGRCVAAGRKLTLSGELRADAKPNQITGHWFNPDGLGSVRISGVQQRDALVFTFRTKDPESGRDIAQNVEWRIIPDSLHLRAIDRAAPNTLMSEITFSR